MFPAAAWSNQLRSAPCPWSGASGGPCQNSAGLALGKRRNGEGGLCLKRDQLAWRPGLRQWDPQRSLGGCAIPALRTPPLAGPHLLLEPGKPGRQPNFCCLAALPLEPHPHGQHLLPCYIQSPDCGSSGKEPDTAPPRALDLGCRVPWAGTCLLLALSCPSSWGCCAQYQVESTEARRLGPSHERGWSTGADR